MQSLQCAHLIHHTCHTLRSHTVVTVRVSSLIKAARVTRHLRLSQSFGKQLLQTFSISPFSVKMAASTAHSRAPVASSALLSRAYVNPFLDASSDIAGKHASLQAESDAKQQEEAKGESKKESTQRLDLLTTELATFINDVCRDFSPRDSASESIERMRTRELSPWAYEGVTGIGYMFAHLEHAAFTSSTSSELKRIFDQVQKQSIPFEDAAMSFAQRAVQMCQYKQKHSSHLQPPSFYLGAGGPFALLSTVLLRSQAVGAVATSLAAVEQLLAIQPQSTDSDTPDEILYGRAGYLHCLLLCYTALKAINADHHLLPDLRSAIDATFDSIIARGRAYKQKASNCPLMWEWHGSKYLGAAHGVCGILYMLLQCTWRFASSDPHAPTHRQLVTATLDYLCSIRLPSGNLPSSDGKTDDRLVQWCHGAPGLALVCVKAYEVLGEAKYLNVAKEAAEVVWRHGLLRKGVGLCHGIGGNGYVFLRLHDATSDPIQLQRAYDFARYVLTVPSDARQQLLSAPDVPSSLGNGRAGFCCFLADLIRKMGTQQPTTASASTSGERVTSSGEGATPPATQTRACFPGMDVFY